MFVRNKFQHDQRVTRQALTLIANGFHVVVFAVATHPSEAGRETVNGIEVHRMMLETPISKFVRALGSVISRWNRLVRRVRRNLAVRVLRRVLRIAKRVVRGKPMPRKAAPPIARPASVRAANSARDRIRVFLQPAHRFFQAWKFGRRAGAAAASMKPVAYHCHDLNAIMAGYLARRIHRAPMIYDSHELWPHRNRADKRRRKTFVLAVADAFFSRRADAVITVCESIAVHMEKHYRLRKPVNVIRNTPMLYERHQMHTVADDVPRPRIMYVGGIQTHRGLEQLIDSMAMIDDGNLIAIGPGLDDYRATLERRARAAGTGDRVRFPGLLPHVEVIETLAKGDVGTVFFQNYCLSYYYSLPNKFFECIHAGLPVVASNFPELQRLIDRYEVGITCDPHDTAAIARAVNWMLANPAELARMRENTKKAAAELNWERESEKYVGIYRALVGDAWPAA
jgi:glycosyltransferase involved in cell wall biosynthesis